MSDDQKQQQQNPTTVIDVTLLANLGVAEGSPVAGATGGGENSKSGGGPAKIDPTVWVPPEWDPEVYGVGVRVIDEQHQQLIQTIAKLCQLGKQVNAPPSVASPPNAKGAGAAGAKAKAAPPGSPQKAMGTGGLGTNVRSPMSMKGALMMDMKNFQDEEAAAAGGDEHDETKKMLLGRHRGSITASINKSKKKKKSKQKKSSSGGGGDSDGDTGSDDGADDNDDELVIRSTVHVYPHRVNAHECAAFVDRGHPPALQLGGEVEPLLDALVQHCSVRLIQEEHTLEAVSFSDRGPHAQEHQIFVRETFRAYQLMEASNFELSDLVALIRFLKLWLRDHIPKDRRAAPLLVAKQN